MTPSGPRITASTSGVSLTQVMMTSAARAASRGDAARRAPALATGSSRSRVRLCTVTVWPALSKFAAMAAPMVPMPINAMFICPRF
jgi:hypothetical protein